MIINLIKLLRENYVNSYNSLHHEKMRILNDNSIVEKELMFYAINKELSKVSSLISNLDVILETGRIDLVKDLNINFRNSLYEINILLRNWTIVEFGKVFGSHRGPILYFSYTEAATIDQLRLWYCSLNELEAKTLCLLSTNGVIYTGIGSRINGEGVEL